MAQINTRIRALRKALHMTQEVFGSILGIGKSGVCDIESGRRRVTEAHILMLTRWNGGQIREEWLRDGTGEMFASPTAPGLPPPAVYSGDDEFVRTFLEFYMELDNDSKVALKKIVFRMADKYSQNK